MEEKIDQNDQANRQADRKNVRVQLDFDPDAYEEVVDLKFALRLKTKADVIRYALRVLRWTVEQNNEGNKILVDAGDRQREVVFPFLPNRRTFDDGRKYVQRKARGVREGAGELAEDQVASAQGQEGAVIGKTYLGKVVRLTEFGAFVEIFPGTEGLLHVSEISEKRIRDIRDELNVGDQVLVKVLAIEGNKIRLSRKAILREQRENQQGQGKAMRAASDLGQEAYQREKEQQG